MGNASEVEKPVWRGEAALLLAVIVNSFGVVLMLYSGSGISAISSVPFQTQKCTEKVLSNGIGYFRGELAAL